jgi:hypothetical protein
MEQEEREALFDYLETRLSGLDQVTRREVLKALLKSSAFLVLLSGGGAGMLAPALVGAAERKFISAEALTAPVPDSNFKRFRALVSEGSKEMLEQILREIIWQVGIHGEPHLPGDIREIIGGLITENEPCSGTFICPGTFACTGGHSCDDQSCEGTNTCPGQNCTDNTCTGDFCGTQGCGTDSCSDNVCDGGGGHSCNDQTIGGGSCEPTNGCGDQDCTGTFVCGDGNSCGYQSQCPRHNFAPIPELLDRYSKEPFVMELKELFGKNVEAEIASMIRARTTLRGRGLIDPGAPTPPSTRRLDDMLRDMPGTRMPQPSVQPGVQPPAAPTAPTAPLAEPRPDPLLGHPTAPPTAAPTAPPPAYTPPPGTKPPTPPPVAPKPVAPPPVVPTPVVPAPVAPTPTTPTPVTPPKPIL